LPGIGEWRQSILKLFVVDVNQYRSITKETVIENFTGHVDKNTNLAFNSLIQDRLLVEIKNAGKIFYCLNIFDRIDEIEIELVGNNTKLAIDIDQPLDAEFDGLIYVFQTEANRGVPNRGKYYHCRKKDDSNYWITLIKPKGNSKARSLPLGSVLNPKSRIYRILKAIQYVSRKNKNGEFVRKNVEDIEPSACGNQRQHSKAAFDILEHEGIIQAVGVFRGKSVIYRLVIKSKNDERQITLDEIFENLSTITIEL
jgi:hypothetical protein